MRVMDRQLIIWWTCAITGLFPPIIMLTIPNWIQYAPIRLHKYIFPPYSQGARYLEEMEKTTLVVILYMWCYLIIFGYRFRLFRDPRTVGKLLFAILLWYMVVDFMVVTNVL